LYQETTAIKFVAPFVWEIMMQKDIDVGANMHISGASTPPSMDRHAEVCRVLLAGGANESSRSASSPEMHAVPLSPSFFISSILSAMPATAPIRETSRVPHFRQLRASARKKIRRISQAWRELQSHLGAGAPFLY